MSYQIEYHPEVKNDIASLPVNIKARLRKAIEGRLMHDPLHYGDPLRKSLFGYRKLRVGDYRIIYRLAGEKIIVLKIGHRRKVYDKVKKRLPG